VWLRSLQPQLGEDRSADNLRVRRIGPTATRIGVNIRSAAKRKRRASWVQRQGDFFRGK
jgi:hypothetical protein